MYIYYRRRRIENDYDTEDHLYSTIRDYFRNEGRTNSVDTALYALQIALPKDKNSIDYTPSDDIKKLVIHSIKRIIPYYNGTIQQQIYTILSLLEHNIWDKNVYNLLDNLHNILQNNDTESINTPSQLPINTSNSTIKAAPHKPLELSNASLIKPLSSTVADVIPLLDSIKEYGEPLYIYRNAFYNDVVAASKDGYDIEKWLYNYYLQHKNDDMNMIENALCMFSNVMYNGDKKYYDAFQDTVLYASILDNPSYNDYIDTIDSLFLENEYGYCIVDDALYMVSKGDYTHYKEHKKYTLGRFSTVFLEGLYHSSPRI